jgi:hypothetical protein
MIENDKILKLENLLKYYIRYLNGAFVSKNSVYDGDICNIIQEFTETTTRYWDCVWESENLYIEFKKGKSIWLDLVRYSEIVLNKNNDARKDTFTLFFIPNNDRSKIVEIIGVETNRIIDKVKLDEKDANQLLDLNDNVPRSFNAQASLTVKDIKDISNFIVS